jgi:hypothetical protein
MSEVDELIARLTAEGELDSTGGFTLDPAVALAKLREHQLRDPSRFVLSWVRAAALLGALRVDLEIDADDVFVRFEAPPLSRAELDRLWLLAAEQRGSLRAAGAHELALGIHGAFAWSAKAVTITSGTVQGVLDREFRLSCSDLARPSPVTIVHAKRPLGWDLIGRKRLDARGQLPEELALAHACARAGLEVVLEGRRLDDPRARDLSASSPWFTVELDQAPAEVHGTLVVREGARSVLHLLKAGVLVTELELPYAGVEAVVDDPWLPLDLSQEKPVEGERLAAIFAALDRARWRAWFGHALAQGWSGPCSGTPSVQPAYAALVAALLRDPTLSWAQVPGAAELASQIELPRAVDDPAGGFRSLTAEPVPRADRGSAPPLTLAAVVEAVARDGYVRTAGRRLPLPYLAGLPVLEHSGPPTPWQRSLEAPEQQAEYWRAARARRLSGAKLLADAPAGIAVASEGYRVWIAWLGTELTTRGLLVLGRDGARLAELLLPPSCGPIRVDVDGPFEAFAAGGELALDFRVATAVLAALSRVHDLLAAVAAGDPGPGDRAWIHAYLRAAHGRWSAQRLAEMTEIPAAQRAWALMRWSGPWGVPSGWTSPEDPDAVAEALAHPLAAIGWLEQGAQRWSYRELHAATRSGPLAWIDRDAPPAELPAEVLRLSAAERRQIPMLLPDALVRFDRDAWARRDHGPATVPDVLHEGPHLPLSGPTGIHGRLALVDGAWTAGASLRILVRGHERAAIELPLPLGRFVGVLELPRATVLPYTQQIAKDAIWLAAVAAVEDGAMALAKAKIGAWDLGAPALFGDRQLVEAWATAFERGAWPDIGAQFLVWQGRLAADHPLRITPLHP